MKFYYITYRIDGVDRIRWISSADFHDFIVHEGVELLGKSRAFTRKQKNQLIKGG